MKVRMFIIVVLGVFLLTGVPCLVMAKSMAGGGLVLSDIDPTAQKKCQYGKIHSKYRVICYDLNYDEFPQTLRKDIEILYFTRNRVTELTNATLEKFTDLSYISFQDNFITKIDTGAFESQKKNIQVIDLYRNAITKFPMNVFEYPELTTVSLGRNKLTDESLNHSVLSRIVDLDISQNELLTKLPTTMSMPNLKYLNVSLNKIIKITPADLAHFCSIKLLDIDRNPLSLNACECTAIKEWINTHDITIIPKNLKCDKCTTSSKLLISNETYTIYNKCKDMTSRPYDWTTFCLITSGIVIILAVILFYVYKKKGTKKGNNTKINKELVLSTNGATTELLNNGIKSHPDDS